MKFMPNCSKYVSRGSGVTKIPDGGTESSISENYPRTERVSFVEKEDIYIYISE